MTTLNLKCFKGALLLLFFILLINGISAAPIVVNTTSSTGAGSLTEAIATANASAGYDTILFNIPGTGPHEINYTGWPGANMSDIVITSGVFIDGFSQPGASCGTPLIRINGHGTWGNWTINGANGVVIRGLSITNTQVIINGGSNNRIYGCWFDVAPDGTLVNDNNNASLLLNGTTTGNIIGSTSCRNVFGGAASMAIQIDAGCNSNKIVANYIGTNSTGTALLGGFTSNGIQVSNSINTTIDSNTVVNCGQHGIFITTGNCSGTMIRGNNIGVGADGLKGAGNFGNGSSGIIFNTDNTTSNVTISGNIVAGNGKNLGNVDDVEHGCGIFIKQPGVDFLRINNNIVGVDKNYQLSGNNYAGIYVRSGSDSVTIIGNIVGDNGYRGGALQKSHGIAVEDRTGIPITRVKIQGNYVGVTPNGGDIGNYGNGIEINKVSDFLVGGTTPSERNYVGFNKFATNISDWAGGGIMVNNGSVNGVIQGNYVGLAPDGTSNAGNTNNNATNPSNPNQNAGIACEFSSNIRIENNNISFNNYGIRFSNGAGGAPSGNTIVANTVAANTSHGVFLTGGTNNIFGSATTTAEGNTISNNGGDGIYVLNTATTENQFRRNSISCNTGKGINLNYGANQGNRGKASPVIDINSIGKATLRGTSQPNDIIDIFGNTACLRACDNPLKRQGQTYLATVTADASGNWSWTHNDPSLVNVSATATGICTGGNCNTSEFNTCDSFCEDAVAPTSVSSDRNNFCADDTGNITLTATGGAGETLNWYTSSCGGTLVGTGNPLVIASPSATTTYYARWETTGCANSACASTTVTVNPVTQNPISATTDRNNFCADDAGNITLSASGGSGTTLTWYAGSCSGTPIGTGNDLVIASPTVTTTYYVRWETPGCTPSGCVSTTVTVNPVTVAPTSVSSDRDNFCADDAGNITLTATGGSGEALNWYTSSCGGTLVGTGNPLVIASPSVTTTYYARWETTGCAASTCASTTVTVNPVTQNPISATTDRNNFCADDAGNITLSASGGSGTTLTWYAGSCSGTPIGTGNDLVIASPTVTTTYYVRWETPGCTPSGCVSTTVTVNPVTVAPTSVSSDRDNFCADDAGNITLTATGGSGEALNWYTSSCGGTLVGTGNPLVIASPSVTTTYYARWETTGCANSACASTTVTVNPVTQNPVSATTDRNNFCADDAGNIILSASGGSGTTLTWYAGSCSGTPIGTGNDLVIASPTVTTTYYVRWETPGCTPSGCASTTVTVNPVTVAPTSASVDRNNFCSSDAGNIQLSAVGGSGDILNWYTESCGGTLVGTGNPLVIESPASDITYYARWETPGCAASNCASVSVTVDPGTTDPVTINVDRNNLCVDDAGDITLTATGGTGGTMVWYEGSCGSTTSIGTGEVVTIPSPTVTTTYFVRWESSSGDCANSNCISTQVVVTPVTKPEIDTIGPAEFCYGGSVELKAKTFEAGVAYNYQWYKDGVAINGATSDTYIADTTGNYTVIITHPTSLCVSDESEAVSVKSNTTQSAQLSITDPAEFCYGNSVLITATSSDPDVTYQWYKDGVTINGATSDTYIADTTGIYSVVLVHNTTNCTSGESNKIDIISHVTPQPEIVVNDPTTFCSDQSAELTAELPSGNAAGYTYQWYKDGVIIINATNKTYVANEEGNYTVIVTNSTTNCPSDASDGVDIIVNQKPVASISGKNLICTNETTTLTATPASGVTYQWYFGGVLITDSTNATYTTGIGGAYKVVVETPEGCSDEATYQVTVNPAVASIDLDGPDVFCEGGSVRLTAYPSGGSYLWSDGSTGSSITTDTSGTYWVKVTVGDCVALPSDEVTITVKPRPQVIVSPNNSSICYNVPVKLTATASGGNGTYSYVWTNSLNEVVAGDTSSYETKIAGVYTVTVVSDGCSAYDFATVKVISPYGDAGGDSITSTLKACFGFPVDIKAKLYNHTENTIYWWEPGNAVTLLDYLHEETDLDPTFVAPAAGVYKYYLFVEEPGTGCKAVMDSVNIIIHSLPSIEAMAGKNPVCIGGEAELFVTSLLSDKYTYFWYKDGETEPFVSGDSVKSVVYNATNNFMVVAIDSNLCVDTVNVVVSAIEKQNLKIPNLLTPNGDGYNDTFLIMDDVGRALLPGAKLEVYNRWGTRVFRTNDYDNNWTPDIVDGVYYYDLTPGCGNEVKRGWIHIINNEGNVGRTE